MNGVGAQHIHLQSERKWTAKSGVWQRNRPRPEGRSGWLNVVVERASRPFISWTARLACHVRINQTGGTPVPLLK